MVRPHSSLGYLTPAQIVARGAKSSDRQATGRTAAVCFFVVQAEVGIRDFHVTGVQTCALPISGGDCHKLTYTPLSEAVRYLFVQPLTRMLVTTTRLALKLVQRHPWRE